MNDTRVLTTLNFYQVEKLSSYTSVFNERTMDVWNGKLKVIKAKLEQESKIDIDNEEEYIHKLNFMTWIEFRLRDFPEAKIRNDVVMSLTKNDDVTALTGRAWIALEMGDIDEVDTCLDLLDKLMSSDQSKLASIKSRAQMAYCFCRLNTQVSLRRGIKIYKEVIKEFPDNYNWLLGLGLAYRIDTKSYNTSRFCTSAKEAADCFCCIINNSTDKSLLRQAYSQIFCLKQMSEQFKLNLGQYHELLNENTEELSKRALDLGADDPKTLMIVGETWRKINKLDDAIHMLKKSLEIKESSITLTCLGKCFEHKIRGDANMKADDELGKKAIESYKKSIKLSQGINIIAIYNLGKLLDICGRKGEALEHYLHIISQSQFAINAKYFFQLSASYKNAALCILNLTRDSQEKTIEKVKAETMLLQFANLSSELHDIQPQDIINNVFHLLNKERQDVPDIFYRIQSLEPTFSNIKKELNCLLTLKKYESAYTLLSLMKNTLNSAFRTMEYNCLILKVRLLTMATRLQNNQTSVHLISQPLFTSSQQEGGHCLQQTDIVILYDIHQCDSKQRREIMLFKDILTGIFGLDVYLIRNILQKSDITTTKLLLVLIHRMEPSSFFQQNLIYLTSNDPKIASAHSRQTNIVIGQLETPMVKQFMTTFPCIQFGNLLQRVDNNQESLSIHQTVQDSGEFRQQVHDLMSIYCLLIGQTWHITNSP